MFRDCLHDLLRQQPTFRCGPIRLRWAPVLWGILLGGILLQSFHGKAAETSQQPLYSVRDIRRLPRSNALEGIPVSIRGVVLLQDTAKSNLYIRDLTGATRVHGVEPLLSTGDYVEIEGITSAGYAPEVVARRVARLGRAPVGRGAAITVSQLRTGTNEAQWVRWEGGRITEVMPRPWGHELRMSYGDDALNLWVLDKDSSGMPTNLLHSRASVQCVVEITTGPSNHYVGSRFLVPGWRWLTVDAAGAPVAGPGEVRLASEIQSMVSGHTEVPDDDEPQPILAENLLQFRAGPAPVRARGVVLFQVRPTRVYCQDATGPLRVDLAGTNSFDPGDVVEIVGYPQVYERRAWIRDATMERLGREELPSPVLMTLPDVLKSYWDARPVRMRGMVEHHEINRQSSVVWETCVVRDQSQRGAFHIRVPVSGAEGLFPVGAQVEVEGLCVLDGPLSGGGFIANVYARSATDVRVLQAPPFWNGRRFAVAFAIVLGAAAFMGIRSLEQRRQLLLMKRSELRLRTLLENAFDATFVLNQDGTLRFMSPSGRRLLGDEQSLGGKTFRLQDALHPEDQGRFNALMDSVIPVPTRTAQAGELRIRDRMGAWHWIEVVVTMSLHVMGVEGLVVHVRDITAQKQAYIRLEQSMVWQRRLNHFATSLSTLHHEDDILWEITRQCISVLGFVDCVIYRMDPLRQVLVQRAAFGPKNPSGREILQPLEIPVGKGIVGAVAETCSPELVPDTRLDARYIVDDARRLSEVAVPIVNEGEVLGVIDSEHPEAGFFTPDHLTFLTAVASLCANKLVRARAERRLRQLNSELERRIADRTEELVSANQLLRANAERLKQAEEELLRALAQERELSQLKTRFVSMVSHELRNPLGVVMCSADILSNYFDELSESERADQLMAIHESTARMARLMEEVLLLGRVDSGRIVLSMATLDLPLLCRRIAGQVVAATGRRCSIVTSVAHDAVHGEGDENLIAHILTNLISNAVKYSPPGGEVILTVRREGSDGILSVVDQGIGIREQDRQHLFHAFYRGSNTANTPGSGLGLVIAKRCTDLHGGRIDFRSVENVGSTFEVRLPLYPRRTPTRITHESNIGH